MSKGQLYAWGAGHTGLLGAGAGEDQSSPTLVPDLPPVEAVAVGTSVAYALDANGRVFSWGWDAFQHLLGRGDVQFEPPWIPTVLREMGHTGAGRMEGDGGVGRPSVVEGLPPVKQIAVAADNGYALTTSGEVWAWGAKAGLGRKGKGDASTPQRLDALDGIEALAASLDGPCCYALDSEGSVWSWGGGWEGELGQGKRGNAATPGRTVGLPGVRSVHASDLGGWAVVADGSLYYWGHGEGVGLIRDDSYWITEPVRIDGVEDVLFVVAGPGGCIVRTARGEVLGIGMSVMEMFGIDVDETGPIPIPSLRPMRDYVVGDDHGLAWDDAGVLFSFGQSEEGALGRGTADDTVHELAKVPDIGRVVRAFAGNGSSMAIVEG